MVWVRVLVRKSRWVIKYGDGDRVFGLVMVCSELVELR
jgi:hypothetical protein